MAVCPVWPNVGALTGHSHSNVLPGFRLAPQPGKWGTKGGGPEHHYLRHQGGLGRTDLRDSDLAEPSNCCGRYSGKDSTDRTQLPVQSQFPQERNASMAAGGTVPAAAKTEMAMPRATPSPV
jgi:hypothetical protein